MLLRNYFSSHTQAHHHLSQRFLWEWGHLKLARASPTQFRHHRNGVPPVVQNFRQFAMSAKINAAVHVTQLGSVKVITMNRAQQRNAMNEDLWLGLTKAIKESDADDSSNLLVLAGNDKSFCSGLDLQEYRDALNSSIIQEYAKRTSGYLIDFTASLIDCKKPIVALVQGSAVGIGVTLLPLCDIVYASDKATFTTPFTKLGIVAECCSSYTIPKIMGYAKAATLLYCNQTMGAEEAHNFGLVSEVVGHQNFVQETNKLVESLTNLASKPLLHTKQLIRSREREILHQVNKKEADAIEHFLQSKETRRAVLNFFDKKKK